MEGKPIRDIRLFEDRGRSKGMPDYVGQLYTIDKWVHLVAIRFARKLRERGFISGNADHLYVILTPQLDDGQTRCTKPAPDKNIRYVEVGMAVETLNKSSREQQVQLVLERIVASLLALDHAHEQDQLIHDVHKLVLEQGEALEIEYLHKETAKYRVLLSYRIGSQLGKSAAIATYWDKVADYERKGTFLTLRSHEDLHALAASIQVKQNVITLKPRTSLSASYTLESYQTPVTIEIDGLPMAENQR